MGSVRVHGESAGREREQGERAGRECRERVQGESAGRECREGEKIQREKVKRY